MKNKYILFIISILFLSIAACKKGDKGDAGPAGPQGAVGETADARIFNKWQVVSGGQYLTVNSYYDYPVEYLQVVNNNSFYFLMQDSVYGFRTTVHDYALINSGQICMLGCVNYSITGDTLKLTNPVANTTTVCVKNANAPSGDQWVQSVKTILDSISIPSYTYYGGDFGYDGHYLWLADDDAYLYQIDPSSHSVMSLNYLPMSVNMPAVEYASGYLWVGDDYGIIHKIDPVTVVDLQQSPHFEYSSASGLAWDNQLLRVNKGGYLYKYDKDNNYEVGYDQLPYTYFYGMAYANGKLFITDGYYIYKVSLSPFKVLSQYQIDVPGLTNISGMAFDGTNFWVAASRGYYGTFRLYKIALN